MRTASKGGQGKGSETASDLEMANNEGVNRDGNAANSNNAPNNTKQKQKQKETVAEEPLPSGSNRPTDQQYMDHLETLYSSGSGKSTCVSPHSLCQVRALTQEAGGYTCTSSRSSQLAGQPES